MIAVGAQFENTGPIEWPMDSFIIVAAQAAMPTNALSPCLEANIPTLCSNDIL